ncbi:MAG: alginate lyase family protein [bacterium]
MDKLLSKIKRTSFEELLFRIKKLILVRLEWLFNKNITVSFRGFNVQDKQALLEHIKNRDKPFPFFDKGEKESIYKIFNTYFPNQIERYIEEADKICKHNFSFLGVDIEYKDRIEWNKDPLTKQEYPHILYTNIYKSSSKADVKHVWELNRHEHLLNLGIAYCFTSDEEYTKEFCNQVVDWIDANPYLVGVNWSSSLEVAVRAINWVISYYLFLDSKYLDKEVNYKILNSLYQHGRYIIRNLSFFSSPYNHLIGEATAIFILGFLFPEFKEATQWKTIGWQILTSQIEKQFFNDGGGVEQAISYHHYTLGFYLLGIILQIRNGIEINPQVLKVIEKAIEFSMYFVKPDGNLPMIGDADDARAIKFGSISKKWDFRTFLAIGAVLFNRADFKRISGKIGNETLWLLGIEGLKKYNQIAPELPKQTSMPFYSSGYFIMRSDWGKKADYLCLDCGPQSAGLYKNSTPSVAHGHADALSFELVLNGRPVIIDAGMFSYHDEYFQNYFRSTPAHNTIVIDGKSQATLIGKLGWAQTYTSKCTKWFTSKFADYVEGEHDGYAKEKNPLIHKRVIFFNKLIEAKRYWVIFDYLAGKGKHLIEQYFHFVPTKIQADKKTIYTNDIFLIPINPDLVNLEIEEGWIAESYGVKIKAPVAKYSTTSILPLCLGVIIYPNIPKIELLKTSQDITAFKLITPNWVDYHLLSKDVGKRYICEGIETDAKFSFLRMDNKGNIIALTIIQCSIMKINQKEIFSSTQLTDEVKIW